MSNLEPIAMDCPIDSVTVLEDRALVERKGRVRLPAGISRLRLDGVAPVAVDKTVTASLDSVKVLGVQVRRLRLHRSDDQETLVRDLEELERKTQHACELARRDMDARRAEITMVEATSAFAASDISDDVAWGMGGDTEAWETAFERFHSRLRSLYEMAALDAIRLKDADREFQDVGVRLRDARQSTSRERAWIEVSVQADESVECDVEIGYAVPCACWRPRHSARRMGETVTFDTSASVWQNTGEDWNNVRLFVSTERASLGVDPPELSTDRLAVKRKQPDIEVAIREQEVEQAGGAAASGLPGIDDGGEAWLVPSEAPASVRSGGRPHRIPLGSFEAPVKSSLVVMAELQTVVIRKTNLVNESTRPILAGPVDLFENSGPVGRTKVLFVAPGERFDLGWGPETELRVSRTTRQLDEKQTLLSGWHRTPHRVELKLSNIGSGTHDIEVVERVPVSEIEAVEIKVERDGTTDGKEPDQDGFVRWLETLRPSGRSSIQLAYVVSKKGDVTGL